MTRGIYLSLDFGTTVLKAAAFRGNGALLCETERRLPVNLGAGGERDQDPTRILHAMKQLVNRLLNRPAISRKHIAGIGLAAQGGSGMVCRRDSGDPLSPLYLWNDTRHVPYRAAIAEAKPIAYWRRLTLRDIPGTGLARMRMLNETQAGLLSDETIYVGIGEYIFHALTGVWQQDPGNALQIGNLDVKKRCLQDAVLDLAGAPRGSTAPLRKGHATVPLSQSGAKLFKLSAGIPVAGPYMDHEAGFLAAQPFSKRPLQCSLGSAWVGNFELDAGETWSSPIQLALPSPAGAGWLVVQPLLAGNVAWDWALQTFAHKKHNTALGKLDNIFGKSLLPPPGLCCIPWMTRSNPLGEGYGGGVFHGVGPTATRHDMIRAMGFGLCAEFHRVFREVAEQKKVDAIFLGGGASGCFAFRTILATLFAPLPVYRLRERGVSGARGALAPFFKAVGGPKPKKETGAPAKRAKQIRAANAHYQATFTALYGHVASGAPVHISRQKRRS